METRELSWREELLHFAVWILSSLLIVFDMIMIRTVIVDIIQRVGRSQTSASAQQALGWWFRFADQGLLLIMGCIGITLCIALGYYYRRGFQKGLFFQRLARVTVIQLAVVALSLFLQALI